ncbi:MAG TPA: hypothetical protein VM802_13065 [Chitinophaga sp.]|uniref:hypothetical protein n=1 Tax=Chitinophaga sp. TaxID=1869181 RepID=UPI002C7888B2|nr:hypothetical protein [Chitinophaga sp.]HVI45799.1 hypothetical protein [Chitinophaga sp.]
MKAYRYYLLMITVSTLLFSACRKAVLGDEVLDAGAQHTTAPSQWLISKVSFRSSVNDAVSTVTISYNSFKKPVQKIEDQTYAGTHTKDTILYKYNSKQQLTSFYSRSYAATSTIKLSYDVQGRIIRKEEKWKEPVTYTYVNDTTVKAIYTEINAGSRDQQIVYYFYDSNKNLRQTRHFGWVGNITDTLNITPWVTDYLGYDSQLNINKGLNLPGGEQAGFSVNIWSIYPPFYDSYDDLIKPFFSANNPAEAGSRRYSYTYNNNNLVTKLEVYNLPIEQLIETYEFEYVYR